MAEKQTKGLPTPGLRAQAQEIAERNERRGNEGAVRIFLRMAGRSPQTIRKHITKMRETAGKKQQ